MSAERVHCRTRCWWLGHSSAAVSTEEVRVELPSCSRRLVSLMLSLLCTPHTRPVSNTRNRTRFRVRASRS